MTATEVLDHLRAQGITLTCTGATLRVSPRSLVTEAVSELIQIHKPALLPLLTGEAAASSRAVEPAAQQREESHVAPAVEAQSLSPAPCSHATTYRRPSGVLVCLDCGQAQVPGNPTWHRQQPLYCDEGQHMPYPDTPADHPRQCMKCPYVWDTPAADTL